MHDEEHIFEMRVLLDADGFLRRECPTCEREFKWLAGSDADEGHEEEPGEVLVCPYCGVDAPPGAWHTKAQIDRAQAMTFRELVEPELRRLAKSLKQLGRSSGGLIEARMEIDEPEEFPGQVAEDNDMRRVDFPCHPRLPVKVVDDWSGMVYCLTCGSPVMPSTD